MILPAVAIAAAQACTFTCFGGSTWISLARGRKRLRDVKVGDVVKTYDVRAGEVTTRPVIHVFSHGPQPVGQLMSRSGAGPRSVTKNHPIFLDQLGEFAPAGTFDRENRKRHGIQWDDRDLRSIELEPFRAGPTGHFLPVYNLSIAETETYFADGLLVHNKSIDGPCHDDDHCYPSGGAGGLGGSESGGASTGEGGAGGDGGEAGSAGAAGSER